MESNLEKEFKAYAARNGNVFVGAVHLDGVTKYFAMQLLDLAGFIDTKSLGESVANHLRIAFSQEKQHA